jgi:hypothetical protein
VRWKEVGEMEEVAVDRLVMREEELEKAEAKRRRKGRRPLVVKRKVAKCSA